MVEYLISIKSKEGESAVNINARDRGDYTAVLYAASRGHFDVVKLLVDVGADLL